MLLLAMHTEYGTIFWHVGVELGGAIAPLPLPLRPKSAYGQGGLAHNSPSTCKGNVPIVV